tara:strand:- start:995 stop:1231 length:237 start_codon:yes stop_codon:yes gene_type:complete
MTYRKGTIIEYRFGDLWVFTDIEHSDEGDTFYSIKYIKKGTSGEASKWYLGTVVTNDSKHLALEYTSIVPTKPIIFLY